MSAARPSRLMPVLATLAASPPGQTPIRVRTVTDTPVGAVGGVAVDRPGPSHVADLAEHACKVQPGGRTELLAEGLHGARGDAIESRGWLLRSNFRGNSVAPIDRGGSITIPARGLAGPVVIAVGSADALTVASATMTRANPAQPPVIEWCTSRTSSATRPHISSQRRRTSGSVRP